MAENSISTNASGMISFETSTMVVQGLAFRKNSLPFGDISNENAGANHIFESGSELGQYIGGNLNDPPGLLCRAANTNHFAIVIQGDGTCNLYALFVLYRS